MKKRKETKTNKKRILFFCLQLFFLFTIIILSRMAGYFFKYLLNGKCDVFFLMGLASGYLSQDFSGLNDFFPILHFSILPPWNWLCVIPVDISFHVQYLSEKAKQKSSNHLLPHTKIFWRHCKAALFMKAPHPPTVCTYKGEDRTKNKSRFHSLPPPNPPRKAKTIRMR